MAIENLITEHIDIWTSAVKTKATTGRGSSKKLELYGVKKLRELILELAVRGKLVPQDPNDEPASVLAELADRAKDRLVAKKIIRKQKSLELINKEDMPFSLPKNWAYHRLGSLGLVGSSSRVQKKDWTDNGVPFYRAREIVKLSKNGFVENELFISEELFIQMSQSGITPEENDIMFTGVGTIGVPHVVKAQERFYFKDASVLIFKNIAGVNADYLSMYMRSPLWNRDIHEDSMGTTVHTLTIARANNVVTPVPPIKEQHRIVTKVNELMTLCDQLEQQTEASIEAHQVLVTALLDTLTNSADAAELMQNWERISEHFDTLFTTEESIDQLKQTILQLAVMGKLVPQNPSDEPAAKLLERIAEEKAQLIKEKQIKKQKALPPITKDEKPFELPNGWEWCYLQDLFSVVTDGDHQAPPKADRGVPFLVIGNLNTGSIKFEDCKFVPGSYYQKLDWTRQPVKGDLLYTVTGSYGIPIVVTENKPFCVQRHVAILNSTKNTPIEFIRYVLLSKYSFDFATSVATGIAQKTVPLSGLRRMPIPLPPKNEVVGILEKIEVMMSICEQLKTCLKESQITQLHLTDAIVEHAV